jgi:hypothetical protein
MGLEMIEKPDLISVHVNVDLPTQALKRIVEQAKRQVGVGERGYYQIDTAAVVGKLISDFLLEKDFEAYTNDAAHYEDLC